MEFEQIATEGRSEFMKFSLVKIAILIVMGAILAGVVVGIVLLTTKSSSEKYSFPENFKFGAASASYQIEGGWNEDGKTPNIWDTIARNNPNYVVDGSNGDVAANSYHFWEKDIEALDNIKVSFPQSCDCY